MFKGQFGFPYRQIVFCRGNKTSIALARVFRVALLFLLVNSFSGVVSAVPSQGRPCRIMSLRAETDFQDSQHFSEGQAWVFLDKTNHSSPQMLLLMPDHVVFGSQRIFARCPGSSKEIKVEVRGTSSVYDLAVGRPIGQGGLSPLFEFDGGEVTRLELPFSDMEIDSEPWPNASAFVWATKEHLIWTSAGTGAGQWSFDPFILLPFKKPLTPLVGVKPGMSGGLAMSIRPSREILGMIMRVVHNGGQSVLAPFKEIVPLLGDLVKGKDPWLKSAYGRGARIGLRDEVSPRGVFRYREFISETLEGELTRLAVDACPSTLVSSEGFLAADLRGADTSGGGATVSDGGGGATVTDSGGGGTVSDGSGGIIVSSQKTSSEIRQKQSFTDYKKQLETVQSVSGKVLWQRNIFRTSQMCREEGIWWLNPRRRLIALRLNGAIVRVNSVRDLLRVSSKDLHGHGVKAWQTFIQEQGVFKETMADSDILMSFCQSGQYLKKDIEPIGILGAESLVPTANGVARIFEDVQQVPFNKDVDQRSLPFVKRMGFQCRSDQELVLKVSNIVSSVLGIDSTVLPRGYVVSLVLKPHTLDIKLGLVDNLTNQILSLEKTSLETSQIWARFFEINGFKFFLDLSPEEGAIYFTLYELPSTLDTRGLLTHLQSTKVPLALMRVKFQLLWTPKKND